ncbi:MAG TPA: ROK family protein [Candidatus Binatia bacterium]|jgi:polyphosphate glucokinase|nr:ROK family protein [Candidatus Binatia bacterium]
MAFLGIDVGGSGIKGALVDIERGEFASERHRIPTPSSLRPDDVLQAVIECVQTFDDYSGPLGIGFPAVVVDGAPRTAFTAHHVPGWIGYPVARTLSEQLGRPVTMLNDADAAGVAEMRFGNGRGEQGVVLILTLGTGIGSALFVGGKLVPNTELGNLYLRNHLEVAEKYASSLAMEEAKLNWSNYATRLDEYLQHVNRLFSPRLIIIGGGISKKQDQFIPRLTVGTRVIPAALRNRAGIIGAAIAAMNGAAQQGLSSRSAG